MFIQTIQEVVKFDNISGKIVTTLFSRPIHKVEVVGRIIMLKIASNKCIFHIDDGSGVIVVTKKYSTAIFPISSFQNGCLMHIVGYLVLHRDRLDQISRSISALSISPVSNNNEEAFHWMECIRLTDSIYSQTTLYNNMWSNSQWVKSDHDLLSLPCSTCETVKRELLFCSCFKDVIMCDICNNAKQLFLKRMVNWVSSHDVGVPICCIADLRYARFHVLLFYYTF